MKASLQYLRYLARHKWFVFLAGLSTHAPLWRLLIHDWSKFLPSEFTPYRDYFYKPIGSGSIVTLCIDGGSQKAEVSSIVDDEHSPTGKAYRVRPLDEHGNYIRVHPEYMQVAEEEIAIASWKVYPAEIVDFDWKKTAFNRAWLLHQNRQPHHWQFWLLVNDEDEIYTLGKDVLSMSERMSRRLCHYSYNPEGERSPESYFRVLDYRSALPMPDKFVREMVADWAGAGRAVTGKWEVHAWYEKNKENIVLHPETRKRVEALLDDLTFVKYL